jgi:plasmid maintenance system antidote protein VapI
MKEIFEALFTRRLERYFGIEAQFWLNLQTEFDLRTLKRKIWAEIESRVDNSEL